MIKMIIHVFVYYRRRACYTDIRIIGLSNVLKADVVNC